MFLLLIVPCLFSVGSAIVCTPELCANAVQEPLDCKGSVIKSGGFCGCTDVCAKQENEECQSHYMFGIIPAGSCDSGLTCIQNSNHPMAFGRGICVKTETADMSRAVRTTLTACQQMRRIRMISMAIWQGWFMPQCDVDGNFKPQQCDNMGRCFCVDTLTGEIDKTSYVQKSDMIEGTSICTNTKRETTQTKCEQMRAIRGISLVIWEGWFMPKCDDMGNFEPEQCDNTRHCFCVDVVDGTVDESTKVLGSADCSNTVEASTEATTQ